MLRAVLSRKPVYLAVVLAVVLGSETAGMLVTKSLIIHGPRASKPAKVGCGMTESFDVHCGEYRTVEAD